MRMMMQMTIPVEAGNHAARTGGLGQTLQKLIEGLKPEAAYFTAMASGERGGFIFFDLKDTADIPRISEPFFLNYNARINFFPVMNAQDLARAASAIEQAAAQHNAGPA